MKDILKKDKLNIIIASNEDVEFLIKTSNSLERVKYLRYQEVIDDFLGSYTFDALLDLNFTKGLTFSNAKILLNNSLLVTKENGKDNINSLLEIKEKYKKYLSFESINLQKYYNSNIILYNYYKTEDILYRALQKLEEQFKVIRYYPKDISNSNIYFNEYLNIDNEIRDLTFKIAELLHNNVPSEDIVIINSNNEYDSLLRAYFNLANISLNDEDVPLIHYEFVKRIINDIFNYENNNLVISFNYVVKKYGKFTQVETKLIKEINRIITKLVKCNLKKEKLKNLVIYYLTNRTIVLNKYTDVINIEKTLNYSYKHIFMIGLSDDKCSYKYKNNDYISDEERKQMDLLTSLDKNIEYEKKLKHFLGSLDNFYLSYSIHAKAGIKQKPSILNSFSHQEYIGNDRVTYSKNIDELKLKILLELYMKYHEESQELYDLAGNYKDAEKNVYNNVFTGINEKLFNKRLNKGLVLSYTSIDEYYKCAFRFYVRKILKISKTSNEDALTIGNIFHKVLSNINEEQFDSDEYIKNYLIINNIDTSGYLGHFIDKYKIHLKTVIPYIKEFHANSKFDVSFLEKEYEVIIDEKYNIKLRGVIDKVMTYDYLNRKFFIVIDYKTGNTKIDFRNLVYGLDMQLLIYFYLLSKHYPTYGFGGSYLQRLLPTSISTFSGKSFDDEFKKTLSLDGYSNSDYTILNFICENIAEGNFVKGINFKKGTEELYSNSKSRTFSDEDFKILLKLTEEKILEAKNNILNSKFIINPKKGNGKDSCEYCEYKDICYKMESDYKKIDDVKDYSFLEDK